MSKLWDYAVEIYGRPGIAPLCLAMQDNYGVNVNLLLFAHWLDSRRIALIGNRLELAIALVADWDLGYVQVLRQLRRQMKDEFAGRLEEVNKVRDHIKAAELAAEKQELLWLEELSAQWTTPAVNLEAHDNMGQNIAIYLAALELDEADINRLRNQFNDLAGS